MKLLLAFIGMIGASAAPAAVQYQDCQTYKAVPASPTVPVVTGQNAAGAPPSSLKCQTVAATPAGWFVRVTTDNGATFNYVPVASLAPAPAPAPKTQAVLTWAAVTTDTTGAPLTVSVTYNVYRGTTASVLAKLSNVAGLTFTDPAGGAAPATYYYAVTATCASCNESAESAVVAATLQAPTVTPAAPGALAIH